MRARQVPSTQNGARLRGRRLGMSFRGGISLYGLPETERKYNAEARIDRGPRLAISGAARDDHAAHKRHPAGGKVTRGKNCIVANAAKPSSAGPSTIKRVARVTVRNLKENRTDRGAE